MTRIEFVMIGRPEDVRKTIKAFCPGSYVEGWPHSFFDNCPGRGKRRRPCNACWNTEIEEVPKGSNETS